MSIRRLGLRSFFYRETLFAPPPSGPLCPPPVPPAGGVQSHGAHAQELAQIAWWGGCIDPLAPSPEVGALALGGVHKLAYIAKHNLQNRRPDIFSSPHDGKARTARGTRKHQEASGQTTAPAGRTPRARRPTGAKWSLGAKYAQSLRVSDPFAHADLVVPLVAHRHFVGTSFEWAGHQVCWRVTVCRHCGLVVGLRRMFVSHGWVEACCDGT
jgi:hypothetical protein